MKFLEPAASGTRHILWTVRIEANGNAQLVLNDQITPTQKAALQAEFVRIAERRAALVTVNGTYRNFIDTAYISVSANQRVSNYLGDVALEDARGQILAKKRDAESAVAGILSKLTEGFTFSRALAAGHERSVGILRGAALVVSLLPDDRFAFANALETALTNAANRLAGFNTERTRLDDEVRPPLRIAVDRAILDLRETLVQANGRLRSHFSAAFIDSLYPELDAKGRSLVDEPGDDAPAAPPPIA